MRQELIAARVGELGDEPFGPEFCKVVTKRASINVSSMISMPSFAPSASKSHDKGAKREQNPPYSHHNGLRSYGRELAVVVRPDTSGSGFAS